VAVDQSSENNRIFFFNKLMDEILMSMRPKLKKVNHQMNIHCADNLVIESKAGPINQIMINLIMNSIIHGFEYMDRGKIDIIIESVDESKVSIEFKDNGKGIPEHLCSAFLTLLLPLNVVEGAVAWVCTWFIIW
jgi:signal transduction histidine kinase